MKEMFSYNKFNNDVANELVDSGYALAQSYMAGKGNTAEYEDANKEFNASFMKYCVEQIPNMVFSSVEMIKDPMIHKNVFFTQTFETILAQVIAPVAPTVASQGYEQLYDVVQVGYGDNAKYTVESNELFIVSTLAEGIARGAVQTVSNTEYTVTAKREQVAAYVDWYHIAS